ncbi:MAG: hypothetical protein PF569_04305 [Candidatus Woesearchaeota archaeon]|jgi:hypothetical protein|nr:hypothetical protein [Candidatus Woesearchaeota archaeon]
MRFSDLIGKHEGASVGVIGSAPSITSYVDRINSECDVVIACNGAVKCLDPKKNFVDYFVYYDSRSSLRDWFYKSDLFVNKNGEKVKRVIPTYMLPFDLRVLKDEGSRKDLASKLNLFKDSHFKESEIIYFNPDIDNLDINGISFRVCDLNIGAINRHDGPLCGKSTITGVGTQLAYKFGASRINLFGCEFFNPLGKERYGYDNRNERGQITTAQIRNMDLILEEISVSGVEIFSFGSTKLEVPKIIY